jgi:hypothetical protein
MSSHSFQRESGIEAHQIAHVAGEDQCAFPSRHQDKAGIDDVARTGSTAKGAGGLREDGIEGGDFGGLSLQEHGQDRLSGTFAPDLGENRCRDDDAYSAAKRFATQCANVIISPLESNERSGV